MTMSPRLWSRRSRALVLAAVSSGLGMVAVLPGVSRVPGALGSGPATNRIAPAAPSALAFRGVTVIDVADGRRLADQTVVVRGTRIQAVGSAKQVPIPAGAQVVDARGRYLIPGLWDMHAHVDQYPDLKYPGFIAYGVTGLREMASRFRGGADSFQVWQREIAAGTRVGPRVVGPSFDVCYPIGDGDQVIRTPEAASRVIDSLKAAGFLFLKVHGCEPTRATFFAIAREARRAGLPFVGHLPELTNEERVTAIEAADSGMRSLEHISGLAFGCKSVPLEPLDTLAEQRCAPVAAALARNGTWLVPTLTTAYHLWGNVRDMEDFVGLMHRAGVPILAGTDWTQDLSYGLSLHDELGFLADAGLTPLEALRTATLNPAIFFHATDSLGTIAPGKLADLVLLDADPLVDIHHTTRIRAVVANGRYFDSTALAALRAVASPAHVHRQLTTGTGGALWDYDRVWRMYEDERELARELDNGDAGSTYFGYRRTARFASPEGLRSDTVATYTAPAQLGERNAWGLVGPWRVTREAVTLPVAPGRLVFRFHARYFNLVFGSASGREPDSVRLRVRLDGQAPGDDHGDKVTPAGDGSERWWTDIQQLVRQRGPGPLRDRTIEIEFLDPVTVYEVTFDATLHMNKYNTYPPRP